MKSKPSYDQAIPTAFLNRMASLLGDEHEPFLHALTLPAQTGLRVNTLKILPDDFIRLSQLNLTFVPWCPSGYTIEADLMESFSPGKHPYHAAGLYYLQEPSAMAAAQVLSPQAGERVLDLSAAPGGKATHLAALMKNSGLLVANEIHPRRVWDLVENLERCGVTNTLVINETPQEIADHFGAYFDCVLLDAPCSGEGMFRKSQIARQEWRPEIVLSCAVRQSSILEQAARLVKPGGRLAYTTCTFAPEENEGVIADFLSDHPDFDLIPIPLQSGFQPARPEWIGLPANHKLTRAIRIWPHLSQGEGHFIALLRRQAAQNKSLLPQGSPKAITGKRIRSGIPKAIELTLDEFIHDNLDIQFDHSNLHLQGSYLYLFPADTSNLDGLNVIRPGWWLGSLKGKQFVPSHALAMAVNSMVAKQILPLQAMDQRVSVYLSGESLPDDGGNGWLLLTVDGYPIGWGKRVLNVIKNYYPHGLRKYS